MRGIQPKHFLTLSEINNNWEEIDSKLYWKVSRGKNRKGNIAGTLKPDGYYVVQLRGINYLVHRLLYQIYHNIEKLSPDVIVDHVDGNRKNNNISNLRLANKSENGCNRARAQKNNTLGYKNIIDQKVSYQVSISKKGHKRYRKSFPTLELALLDRDIKLKEYHEEFMNLGNFE